MFHKSHVLRGVDSGRSWGQRGATLTVEQSICEFMAEYDLRRWACMEETAHLCYDLEGFIFPLLFPFLSPRKPAFPPGISAFESPDHGPKHLKL